MSKIKSVPPSDPTAGQLANDSWKRTSVWEQYSLNDGCYCVCYLQHKWKHSAMLKLPLEECSSKSSKPFRKYRAKMLQKWSLKVSNNSWWASKGLPLERGTVFHSPQKGTHFEHFLSVKIRITALKVWKELHNQSKCAPLATEYTHIEECEGVWSGTVSRVFVDSGRFLWLIWFSFSSRDIVLANLNYWSRILHPHPLNICNQGLYFRFIV